MHIMVILPDFNNWKKVVYVMKYGTKTGLEKYNLDLELGQFNY